MKARRRARDLKIPHTDKLRDAVMATVANIPMDETFTALVELARNAKLGPTKLGEIAKDVRAARSEADQLLVVTGARAELGAASEDQDKVLLPWTRLHTWVTKGHSIDLDDAVKAACSGGKSRPGGRRRGQPRSRNGQGTKRAHRRHLRRRCRRADAGA